MVFNDCCIRLLAQFSAEGKPLTSWGSKGKGSGQFDVANALEVDNGRIYVSDFYNNRIQVFGSEGTFLSQFGNSTNEGELKSLLMMQLPPMASFMY